MKVTQTRYSPHKQARIRAFFAEGVKKHHLPWTVEALPALLHLSLFLFFAGLAMFLFNINHTVFNVAISWIGLCTGVYMCITFMPMFRHDSPYYAPLSSLAWYLYTGILFTLFRILQWIANQCLTYSIWKRMRDLRGTYLARTLRSMEKEFEETALKVPSEIDGRALLWRFESLDKYEELEQFFSGIPGFCSSKVVDDPQSSLYSLNIEKVALALDRFLERTWTSNLISDPIKIRQLVMCIRAIDTAHLSYAAYRILFTFFKDRPALFQCVELGLSLISRGNNDEQKNTLFVQGIITCIIAKAPQRNEQWNLLVMHQLGISEHTLQSYLNHGDSVLLATLIHFTHQFVGNPPAPEHILDRDSLLSLLSRLRMDVNVQDALPKLQHDFCGLWNEIVIQRRDTDHDLLSDLLSEIVENIRPIYLTLHQGSTQHDRYPLCSIPAHRIHPASNLNEVNDGETV